MSLEAKRKRPLASSPCERTDLLVLARFLDHFLDSLLSLLRFFSLHVFARILLFKSCLIGAGTLRTAESSVFTLAWFHVPGAWQAVCQVVFCYKPCPMIASMLPVRAEFQSIHARTTSTQYGHVASVRFEFHGWVLNPKPYSRGREVHAPA